MQECCHNDTAVDHMVGDKRPAGVDRSNGALPTSSDENEADNEDEDHDVASSGDDDVVPVSAKQVSCLAT